MSVVLWLVLASAFGWRSPACLRAIAPAAYLSECWAVGALVASPVALFRRPGASSLRQRDARCDGRIGHVLICATLGISLRAAVLIYGSTKKSP